MKKILQITNFNTKGDFWDKVDIATHPVRGFFKLLKITELCRMRLKSLEFVTNAVERATTRKSPYDSIKTI